MGKVELKPVNRVKMSFWIRGTSPLITHAWSAKAEEMIRLKQAGKKTKAREARDPQQEAMDAAYIHKSSGKFGVPGLGLKGAIVSAAHKDIGIEKTLVRKALFLVTDDPDKVLPLEVGEPTIREDHVRVGMGTADLRYRPCWENWRLYVEFEVDNDLLTQEDVINLVNRAGFGIGLCEWRPEKNGEYGRFEVDPSEPFEVEKL